MGDETRNTPSPASLYVGNVPFSARWFDLKDLFATVGKVAYADIPRGQDGRSRGYGLVRYETEADAKAAIEKYNNYEWNGRTISVREDTKTQTNTRHSVFVGKLPWRTSWQDLKDLAKEHGLSPIRADVAIGNDGRSRGWGTLGFATDEECQDAISKLNGIDYQGRTLEVREDRKGH